MSLADRFESLREVALLDVDNLDDDVLLSKGLEHLAERITEKHRLAFPRLRQVVITRPRAALLGLPGEPGQEHVLVAVPVTRVELWLLVDGFATLSLLAEDGGLDIVHAQVNAEQQCLSVTYQAERPDAVAANELFQHRLYEVEKGVKQVRLKVAAYNDALKPAVTVALQAARGRAQQRRDFADALRAPQPSEQW